MGLFHQFWHKELHVHHKWTLVPNIWNISNYRYQLWKSHVSRTLLLNGSVLFRCSYWYFTLKDDCIFKNILERKGILKIGKLSETDYSFCFLVCAGSDVMQLGPFTQLLYSSTVLRNFYLTVSVSATLYSHFTTSFRITSHTFLLSHSFYW